MTSIVKMKVPTDGRNNPIQRAMGFPIPLNTIYLGSATKFVDIFDLSLPKYSLRAFTGISIRNPSASSSIILAFGQDFADTPSIIVEPQQYFTFDQLTYGASVFDDSDLVYCTKIRAKLDLAQGVFASATIGYGVSGNPTDQMTVEVNGKIYEFSADASKDPGSHVLVPIGASADLTWTSFRDEINANEQALTASIDTGTDVVTLTSNYGGSSGDGLVIVDGASPTGAVFSGNTAGGSGGVLPTFHIW